MKRLDLVGRRFGKLIVCSFAGTEREIFSKGTAAVWNCKCNCGENKFVRSKHLRSGLVKSCGCLLRTKRLVDLTGKKFGKLLVLFQVPHSADRVSGKARWLCKCDCGKEHVTRTDYLRSGRSTSCGCFNHGPRLVNHQAAWNQVWNKVASGAKARDLDMTLTREQVYDLCIQNCHYCGIGPSQRRKTVQDSVAFNGIDRLDSSQGYIPGNVVPCCKWCNFAKHTMGYEEFRQWVRRVYTHFGSQSPLKIAA
jgi:hypothetical protein